MEDSRILELMLRFTEAKLKKREIVVSLKSGGRFKGEVTVIAFFGHMKPHVFLQGFFIGKEEIGPDLLGIDFENVADDEPNNLTVM